MNTDTSVQKKKYSFDPSFKIITIFIIALVVICGLIFIFKYDVAYDDNANGGWLPPSFAVIGSYFLVSVASTVTAICLKLFLKKKARLWALLLVSVIVPIICYNVNYHALKKDGAFHFLVDEGGIFHFIVIGDFNFDGINDERYHILYEKREYSTRYGGDYDDTVIDYIETRSSGIGAGLDGTFCFYNKSKQIIDLHMSKSGVEYETIRLKVCFKDPSFAQRAEFFIDGKKTEPAKVDHCTVELIFDLQTCSEWQVNAESEYMKIPISYTVSMSETR